MWQILATEQIGSDLLSQLLTEFQLIPSLLNPFFHQCVLPNSSSLLPFRRAHMPLIILKPLSHTLSSRVFLRRQQCRFRLLHEEWALLQSRGMLGLGWIQRSQSIALRIAIRCYERMFQRRKLNRSRAIQFSKTSQLVLFSRRQRRQLDRFKRWLLFLHILRIDRFHIFDPAIGFISLGYFHVHKWAQNTCELIDILGSIESTQRGWARAHIWFMLKWRNLPNVPKRALLRQFRLLHDRPALHGRART